MAATQCQVPQAWKATSLVQLRKAPVHLRPNRQVQTSVGLLAGALASCVHRNPSVRRATLIRRRQKQGDNEDELSKKLREDVELRKKGDEAWTVTENCVVRIAVMGNRGVGKSTFVNSLRGLKPKDEGAAPVSANEVKPTELAPSGELYDYLGLQLLDVPGAAGNEIAEEMGDEYIQRFSLHKADAVILMFTGVLSRNQLACADKLSGEYGRPVFFVRSKVGLDCQNEVDDGNVDDEFKAFQDIQKRTYEEMEKERFNHFANEERVFLVEAKGAPLRSWFDRQANLSLEDVKRSISEREGLAPYVQDFIRLQKAMVTSMKEEAKQANLEAILTRNAPKLAKTRAAMCRDRHQQHKVEALVAGMLPPGASEKATEILLNKVAQDCLDIFRLTPELIKDNPQFKGLSDSLGPALLARIAGWTVGCMKGIPAAAPAAVVVGAAASCNMVAQYSEYLIPRLEKIAEAAYKMIMKREPVDQAIIQKLVTEQFGAPGEAKA